MCGSRAVSPPRRIRPYAVPCLPPIWARGGHAQTLLGHLLPAPGPRTRALPGARRRELELADGDRLAFLDVPGRSGVRVHLFHGLSGDVDAEYMRRTASALAGAGHGVWSVNHRGCGEGAGLAARPYHSGKTEDLQAVLALSREEAPHLAHLAIGFSLSANIALLYAARAIAPALDGLIAVNPPADLRRASVDVGRGLSRLYELRFTWRLRRALRARERAGLAPRLRRSPSGPRCWSSTTSSRRRRTGSRTGSTTTPAARRSPTWVRSARRR